MMSQTPTFLLAALWLTLAGAVIFYLATGGDSVLVVVFEAWCGGLISGALVRRYQQRRA